MKKALSSLASGTAIRLCLMLAMVLASLSASAVEWKTFEIGTEYTAPALSDDYYKYTATEDGIVTLVSTAGNMSMGSITIHTECDDNGVVGNDIGKFSYSSYTASDGTTYTQRKQISVTAGQTYYLYVGSTFSSSNKFKGYLDANVTSLTLQNSNFTDGEVFDITDTRYGQLTLTFSLSAAAADSATITANGKSAKIETRSGNSGALSFVLKPTLTQWLNDGIIKGGEELTFTITNVHAKADESILYGTDGTFTMKFLCPSQPHQKTGETIPNPFLSYWVKGNPDGIMTLEFDTIVAPIGQQTAVAVFRLGSADAGDIYVEQFNSEEGGAISVDGNKLLIDFTGKLRTYETMGLKTQWSNVTIAVQNVKMADGSNAYSSGNGTSGSYTFTSSFKEVNGYVTFEWTPADGSQLTDNQVKLYLSNQNVKFESVKFNYQDTETDQKYQETVTNFTSEAQGNAIEYTIPFSVKVKNGKNVRVTLDGVTAVDGQTHDDITAKFNPGPELIDDFDPTAVSPADGSTVGTLDNITLTFDEAVKLNTPTNARQIVFTDLTTGKNIPATIAVSESNDKQVVITPTETLKNTHKYQATIGHAVISNEQYVTTAGKYGRFMKELDLTYTVYTASNSFDFDTDPLEGSTLNEISSIKITTKAGRNASTYGISSTSNPEKEIWIEKKDGSKVATAKVVDIVPSGDEPSGFYITFSPAITEAGDYNVLLGDSTYYVGEGDNAEPNGSKVSLPYTIIAAPTATLAPVEVTPASESTVESLKTITLLFNEDIYGVESPVTALNKATRQSVTGVIVPSTTDNKTAIVTLDEEITADGDWTVTIPQGVVGDKTWWDSDLLTGTVNAALNLYYTVGKASETTVVADPADGSTVTSLGTITLTWPEGTEVGIGNGMISFLDASGAQVKRVDAMQYYVDPDNWDEICHIVTIEANITENGTYKMVVPAGYFVINGADGEEMTFTYTVGETDGISGINADAEGTPTIFTIGGQKVAKANQSGLYIINGKKTVVK